MATCSAKCINKTSPNPSFRGGGCRDGYAYSLTRSTLSPSEGGAGGGLEAWFAFALCFFGCALLTAGIAIPPAGVIDSSVLVAFGEILTFAGSLIGIDYHYRYKAPKGPPLTPPSEEGNAE